MAAGDRPFPVSAGYIKWEKEATFAAAPADAAWNVFGYRVGDVREPSALTTWLHQRGWNSGREASALDQMLIDHGGAPLGEFKLTSPRILGFAWGQELSAPAQIGITSYYRHTVSPTKKSNFDGMSMSVQVHDDDKDGTTLTSTFRGGVMNELEIIGNEQGEVSFVPTMIFRDTVTLAATTPTEPTSSSYKHYHGYVEINGTQALRVKTWRFKILNKATRHRYWNDTAAKYAYEYPFEDAEYILSMRAVADGKAFGASARTLTGLAEVGEIGKAVLRFAKTVDQDEGKIVVGSASDALALISAPRVRRAAGGLVEYELDFACRASTYQYVDTATARYFPS